MLLYLRDLVLIVHEDHGGARPVVLIHRAQCLRQNDDLVALVEVAGRRTI